RELAKRLGDTTINAYSLHPGLVDTEWYRHIESPVVKFIAKNFIKMFAMSVERGTQTTLYCALEESLDSESGFYYENCLLVDNMYANATDDKSAELLWQLSADLVVIITGANTGIGKETAYQLTLRGAKVIIGCRDELRAENAIKEIVSRNPNANIIHIKLDLSSLQSIRAFVQQIYENETKIDILVNNAGVCLIPESTTEDGFEMTFGTNHLGHYLLTLQLLPLISRAPKGRVITVSSALHALGSIHFENIHLRNGAYDPRKAYSQSKLANILFTRELAKHAARYMTGIQKHMLKIFQILFLNVERGSQTTLYCALEESLDNESGYYYDNCLLVDNMYANATDDKSAELLWELSADLLRVSGSLFRVINISSAFYALGSIHFENIHLRNGAYNPSEAYFQSKLANVLFTRELAKRLPQKSSVNVYALHPGAVKTDVARSMTVIITGANAGIGKETAYQLSLRGAKIIIGCRDELRAENAIKEIVRFAHSFNKSMKTRRKLIFL
ncbi:unnamed protein product, partial [Oppiella nova]